MNFDLVLVEVVVWVSLDLVLVEVVVWVNLDPHPYDFWREFHSSADWDQLSLLVVVAGEVAVFVTPAFFLAEGAVSVKWPTEAGLCLCVRMCLRELVGGGLAKRVQRGPRNGLLGSGISSGS